VGYHMMPGILGFKPDMDLRAFKKIYGYFDSNTPDRNIFPSRK